MAKKDCKQQPYPCTSAVELRKSQKAIRTIFVGKNSDKSFYYYAKKVLRKIERPDYLYAHFLRPAGVAAARLGREQKIPSFCAFGESSLWSIEGCSDYEVFNKLRALTGVIAVSTENKRILLEHGLVPEEKIAVFPNGVDLSLFAPLDKKECRRKLGFPDDICIGIFVRGFIEPESVKLEA